MTGAGAPTVRLYTRRWCGYCIAARRLLRKLAIDFEEIRLDGDPELRREISEAARDWPTVPMIFIDERFIGGYTELARLHRRGDLAKLMEGAA